MINLYPNMHLNTLLVTISILLAAMSSSQAGEWSGEVSRQPSEIETLCIELDVKKSPHIQKICLDKISVKWNLQTSEQSALVRSSIFWKLQPALWLRKGNGAVAKQPLASFNKAIQTAYNSTTPTDITLAAFFYPEINSAPDNAASAVNNLGIAVEFEADVLTESGSGYSFNAPSSPDWGALLIDTPQQVPCLTSSARKNPAYIPEDVSKELLRYGMSLSGLSICHAAFGNLQDLNEIIQKSCTLCQPGVGPLVHDAGLSIDDLFAEIDDGSVDNLIVAVDTAGTPTPLSGGTFDDLLAEIDPIISAVSDIALASDETEKAGEDSDELLGNPKENIKQKQLPDYLPDYNDGTYCGGLLTSLEEQHRALIKVSYDMCRTEVNHYYQLIEAQTDLFNNVTTKMSDGDLEKAKEHHKELRHCYKTEVQDDYDFNTDLTEIENTRFSVLYDDKCRIYSREDSLIDDTFPTGIERRRYRLDGLVRNSKRLLFYIGEYKNFQQGSKPYTALVELRHSLIEYLQQQMAGAKQDSAEYVAALSQHLGYNSAPTLISYDALTNSQPELNNEPLPDLTAKPIAANQRTDDPVPTLSLTIKAMPVSDPTLMDKGSYLSRLVVEDGEGCGIIDVAGGRRIVEETPSLKKRCNEMIQAGRTPEYIPSCKSDGSCGTDKTQ